MDKHVVDRSVGAFFGNIVLQSFKVEMNTMQSDKCKKGRHRMKDAKCVTKKDPHRQQMRILLQLMQ